MKFKKLPAVLTLILILAPLASADWQSVQLTDNSYAESMPSIDLDPFDIPHFAWCSNDDGDYDIYYLTEPTGIPLKTTDNNTNDLYPCLQVDRTGNAHIGFKGYDGHDYEEYYITNIGGSFCEPIQVSFTSTDVGVFVPDRSCLAVDSTGVVHIVYKYGYYEYGNWDIYYVNNEGGSFGEPTRITDGGGATSYVRPSFALDRDAFVHVAFEDGAGIIYTNNTGGSFDTLQVVSQGALKWHASLGIDANNRAHISFAGYHGGVYYVNNVSGSFSSQLLLSGDNGVNGPTSLSIDDSGHIHVAYVGGIFGNTNSQELYYLNNCTGPFGNPEQITYNSEHTTQISSCVDATGACHIAYLEGFYGSNDYEVWYTTNGEYAEIPVDTYDSEGCAQSSLLLQNCPNPFYSMTKIRYALPKESNVVLSIHDILGKEIARLVDGCQRPGSYAVSWDGRGARGKELPVGVYFCRIITDGGIATRRVILQK
ncbi:MAG: T9SS type A sorting domain-containing protein [Candidatus Eisenbacteria sp.]|nr:T9SS type A sorting domain-containing protein [Candidatus Eisenbacteria bacterium]